MSYWAKTNWQIVKLDGRTFSLTFTDDNDSPVDVSAWVSYYKAAANGSWTSDTIALTSAGGGITYTDSGTGTTDTLNVIFDEADSDVDIGKYDHHLMAVISSATTTIFLGKLTVVEGEAVVA
jgi:hypothetical protein